MIQQEIGNGKLELTHETSGQIKKVKVVRGMHLLQERILAVSRISISIINFTRTNVKRLAYLKITTLFPNNCEKRRRKKKES
jgi:hypothetical protein